MHHLNIVVAGETPTTPIKSANFLYDKPFVVLNFSNCIHCHYGNETLLAIESCQTCQHITRVVNYCNFWCNTIDITNAFCFIATMVKVIDIKDIKDNNSDMYLKKKMLEVGMDSKELAYKMGVSPVTTFRWEKGERKISPEQAILIAKIIECDPSDILFPAKKVDTIELHSYAEDYIVKRLHKKNFRDIIVPGGFYTPQTKAVQFYAPGREAHNEIHLFERSGATDYDYDGFSEDAINSTCYIEPSDKCRKKGCRDVICLIEIDKSQPTFRLNLLHPETKKPMTKLTSTNVDPREIKIAAPRKMTFYESYNKYKPGRLASNKINPYK